MSDSENAKKLFFEALALMDSSNFQAAESRLREALTLAPGQVSVLTNLSIALVQQNRRAEARDFAEKAIAINSKNVDSLLVLADCHMHDDRFLEAIAVYENVLALKPGLAEIHNNRGLALERLARHAEALDSYERALAINPEFGDAHVNRGNALGTLKRFNEALIAYERALTLRPDFPEAWLGRGNALCDLRRHDDALAAFDRALALRPKLAAAWFGRGNVFYDRKRFVDALAAYDRALALDPGMAGAWVGRGDALRILKRAPEAIAAYRQALALGADADTIRFYLAGLGVEPSPATSPKRFVTNLFDMYADNFEHDLVENLKYHSPDVLADTIKRYAPSNTLDTLDLGCGTGLMGNLLRPISRTLTGVDLSTNMLEKARQRQIYDHVVCCDLIQFLQTQDQLFDLAVATDVFIYVGDLSPVFPAVRRSLREGGLFCFSVEATDEADFVLRSTLRYAHSIGYLDKLARQHRFAVETIEPQVIRRGVEADIDGYHVVMRAIDPPDLV
jgi:predicted TPR repeat methyltransferase